MATDKPLRHSFTNGSEATCLLDDRVAVYHPTAPLKRRGGIELVPGESGPWTYRYLRCRAEDKVPMQPKSWQRAEVVIAPPGLARLTSSLSSPHRVEAEAKLWSALYGDRAPLPGLPPMLEALVRYHRDAIVCSAAVGDDFGNVTGYSDGSAHGGAFGMNRLNHGAAIFETRLAQPGPPPDGNRVALVRQLLRPVHLVGRSRSAAARATTTCA